MHFDPSYVSVCLALQKERQNLVGGDNCIICWMVGEGGGGFLISQYVSMINSYGGGGNALAVYNVLLTFLAIQARFSFFPPFIFSLSSFSSLLFSCI